MCSRNQRQHSRTRTEGGGARAWVEVLSSICPLAQAKGLPDPPAAALNQTGSEAAQGTGRTIWRCVPGRRAMRERPPSVAGNQGRVSREQPSQLPSLQGIS